MLQVKLLIMPYNRDVQADAESFQAISRQLNFRRHTRSFLCVAREQRLSLQLKAQVQDLSCFYINVFTGHFRCGPWKRQLNGHGSGTLCAGIMTANVFEARACDCRRYFAWQIVLKAAGPKRWRLLCSRTLIPVYTLCCMQETYATEGQEDRFQEVQKLLSVPTFDILDECDELLAPKFQLVYAWGSQESLPSLAERVHVVQAVLQVLHDDFTVTRMLADGAFAQVRHHGCRHGGMPEIRLLAGVTETKLHTE